MKSLRAAAKRRLWPLTLPLAAVLWLLEPFLRPRFGRVWIERIGHLAMNTEVLLRGRRMGLRPKDDALVLVGSGPVSNRTLLSLYQRVTPIHVNDAVSGLFSLCRPWLEKTRFYVDLPFNSNEYAELNDGLPLLSFTPEEEERGREGLRRMGVGPKDWFVCFFNRDPSYLKKWAPGVDYAYHDFRDTSIENFGAAAAYVAEQGGFAVRVGAAVSSPLPARMQGPRVIDYATSHRDDFMDVYLMAKARFVITSDSGLGQVPTAFGVPCVNTNLMCADWGAFLKSDLFILKRFVEKKTGRTVPVRELIDRGLQRALEGDKLERAGIEVIENTPEEILGAAREMHERLSGRWTPAPGDEELQDAYRAQWGPGSHCYGYPSRVGAEFLREKKEALL